MSRGKPWLTSKLPLTEGQAAFLQKKEFSVEGMTKAQASMKIREVVAKKRKQQRQMSKEPITEKQAYFLRKRGVNPQGMTKLEAMKAIANIKKERNVRKAYCQSKRDISVNGS